MLLTTVLAFFSAIAATVSLLGGVKKDRRKLHKYEWIVLFLTILTFLVGAYQTWDNKRIEQFHNALNVDWEKELDKPIASVRVNILFPDGTTVENNVAQLMNAMRFQFENSSNASLQLGRSTDGNWFYMKNTDERKPVLATVYGNPLKVGQQRYCWWSDSWSAPAFTQLTDNRGHRWNDRTVCSVQLLLPPDALPLDRLRSLSGMKHGRYRSSQSNQRTIALLPSHA